MFGALLRCVSTIFPACSAITRDGGLADGVVLARLDECDALLGKRFDADCADDCGAANEVCRGRCDRAVSEVCGPCTFDCGRDYAACLRPCLLLPDAGYPDAG